MDPFPISSDKLVFSEDVKAIDSVSPAESLFSVF